MGRGECLEQSRAKQALAEPQHVRGREGPGWGGEGHDRLPTVSERLYADYPVKPNGYRDVRAACHTCNVHGRAPTRSEPVFTSRRERKRRTRADLLQAALVLLKDNGFSGLSL